jgi:hypothetical protein
MGEAPTLTWGTAKHEHDGEILGCSGKHWIPDPVLFGAVGIPSQKSISLPCLVICCVFVFLVVRFDERFILDVERGREFSF